MTRMNVTTLDTSVQARVWNAVYAAETQRGDDALARDLADSVTEAMRHKDDFVNAKKRYEFGTWFVKTTVGAIGGLCALATVVLFIVWLTTLNNGDYAGIGEKHVEDHAREAVAVYYGTNDLPKHLVLTSRQRTYYAGDKAWRVTFRTKAGKITCAYIYGGRDWRSQVREGAGC